WPTASTGDDSPATKIETSCPTARPTAAVRMPTTAPAARGGNVRARSSEVPSVTEPQGSAGRRERWGLAGWVWCSARVRGLPHRLDTRLERLRRPAREPGRERPGSVAEERRQ